MQNKKPSVGGVWIFSGTAHCDLGHFPLWFDNFNFVISDIIISKRSFCMPSAGMKLNKLSMLHLPGLQ